MKIAFETVFAPLSDLHNSFSGTEKEAYVQINGHMQFYQWPHAVLVNSPSFLYYLLSFCLNGVPFFVLSDMQH